MISVQTKKFRTFLGVFFLFFRVDFVHPGSLEIQKRWDGGGSFVCFFHFGCLNLLGSIFVPKVGKTPGTPKRPVLQMDGNGET